MFDDFGDEPRALMADSARGFAGQVQHLIQNVLNDGEISAICQDLDLSPADRTGLAEYARRNHDDVVADLIESHSPVFWEDGDAYMYEYMLAHR